jgi:hypothetical protein
MPLGAYPAVTLADARELALSQRHAIDVQKRNPAAEQRSEREVAKRPPVPAKRVFTFADLAKLYETFAKGKKKTWQDDVGKVKRYLIPAWGNLHPPGREGAMKKTRFTEEQMVMILRKADEKPVPEVAKKHGVTAQTIYAWRKHFGRLEPADVSACGSWSTRTAC